MITSDEIEDLVNYSGSEVSELSYSDSEEDSVEICSSSASECESDISDTADNSAPSWVEVSNFDPGPSSTIPIYKIQQGPVLPSHFDQDTAPIEYFYLFFDDEIFDIITKETCI